MKETGHVKVLVVGDIMLDKYIIGKVERICPEAPVPVVHVKEEYYTLGGCGHVCRNLRELGAQVDCMSSISNDINGGLIINELDNIGAKNLCSYGSKQTIVKERIIADDRKVQMLRVDRETISKIDSKRAIEVFLKDCRKVYDVIIVSDYAKGMITKELMEFLKTLNTKIIVDPKPINGFLYNDAYMITPNEKEWKIMKLSSKYSLKNVKFILETKGKHGMILYNKLNNKEYSIMSEPVEVYNVSGAGDTVVAVMGLCLSMNYSIHEAAILANKCAAYVVTQSGTTTVPKEIFEQVLKDLVCKI
ncbi:MAG: bifunctional heptose 7-phosphate kinase/heptose 1-phosphate adenyltransferase [Thermoplasmata archaeon]|nr:MAG: bifunctional heptose 7-phosphate kinase/heptose 1-phosphate adenyltransferase [Thermoplasmata archaeon]